MAEDMLSQELVNSVSIKQEDGTMTASKKIGATFEQIIDPATKQTLKQFYDNYLQFMKTADFVYYGDTQPTNTHIKLWIDTAHNNQDKPIAL